MIHGVHHVAISVPDMEQAIAFYIDVLGFETLWSRTLAGDDSGADAIIGLSGVAAKIRMIKTGSCCIELWEYQNPMPQAKDARYSPANHGFAHICLAVTDIQAEHDRLGHAGMTFVGMPHRAGFASAIYGRDPFGNIIELYEEHETPPMS